MTLTREAWDKGCTDIMHVIIEYPNYSTISLLTQPSESWVNLLGLRISSCHKGSWTENLTTVNQFATTELWLPFKKFISLLNPLLWPVHARSALIYYKERKEKESEGNQ